MRWPSTDQPGAGAKERAPTGPNSSKWVAKIFCALAGKGQPGNMDLALSAGERRRLRVAMKQAVRARLYRRLQAVLLVGEGRPTKEVAAITGASWRSVQHWGRAGRRSATRRRPEQVLAAAAGRLGLTRRAGRGAD